MHEQTHPMGDDEERRTVKFRIPLDLHLRLHQHRLLGHQAISDTVEAALDKYLAHEMPDSHNREHHT